MNFSEIFMIHLETLGILTVNRVKFDKVQRVELFNYCSQRK